MYGVFIESVSIRGSESVFGLVFGELSQDDLGWDLYVGGDTADSVVVVDDPPAECVRYRAVFDGGCHLLDDLFRVRDLLLSFSHEQVNGNSTDQPASELAEEDYDVLVRDLLLSFFSEQICEKQTAEVTDDDAEPEPDVCFHESSLR